jgi:hypothetical protein
VNAGRDDTRFSTIVEEPHGFRNVHADRWSSTSNHAVGFETSSKKGWWPYDDGRHVNPVIVTDCFEAGFTGRALCKAFDELTALKRKYRLNGAEGQNRTADTVIFSHVLYQLSYLGTRQTEKYSTRFRRRPRANVAQLLYRARPGTSSVRSCAPKESRLIPAPTRHTSGPDPAAPVARTRRPLAARRLWYEDRRGRQPALRSAP